MAGCKSRASARTCWIGEVPRSRHRRRSPTSHSECAMLAKGPRLIFTTVRLADLVVELAGDVLRSSPARHQAPRRSAWPVLLAPFFDECRQEHQRDGHRDQEQLQRQHAVGRAATREGSVSTHGTGDRHERDHEEGGIHSDRAESNRGPEEERQRQIDERRDAAFGCGRPTEDADADRQQHTAIRPASTQRASHPLEAVRATAIQVRIAGASMTNARASRETPRANRTSSSRPCWPGHEGEIKGARRTASRCRRPGLGDCRRRAGPRRSAYGDGIVRYSVIPATTKGRPRRGDPAHVAEDGGEVGREGVCPPCRVESPPAR